MSCLRTDFRYKDRIRAACLSPVTVQHDISGEHRHYGNDSSDILNFNGSAKASMHIDSMMLKMFDFEHMVKMFDFEHMVKMFD
jgi:hypothetical protein